MPPGTTIGDTTQLTRQAIVQQCRAALQAGGTGKPNPSRQFSWDIS